VHVRLEIGVAAGESVGRECVARRELPIDRAVGDLVELVVLGERKRKE